MGYYKNTKQQRQQQKRFGPPIESVPNRGTECAIGRFHRLQPSIGSFARNLKLSPTTIRMIRGHFFAANGSVTAVSNNSRPASLGRTDAPNLLRPGLQNAP